MKTIRTFVVLIIALIVIGSTFALGQTPTQTMPDYNSWQNNGGPVPVVHNGKDKVLAGKGYYLTDVDNLKYYQVIIIFNENSEPWFSFLSVINLEKQQDGSMKAKEVGVGYYVFEYINGSWDLVLDLSKSPNLLKDHNDFMKNRYGIEFK